MNYAHFNIVRVVDRAEHNNTAIHNIDRQSNLKMDRFKSITEFVVVSNLENRALNAGINKAQNWWRNHHKHEGPVPNGEEAKAIPHQPVVPLLGASGRLVITILHGQDMHESRLTMLSASASASMETERPFVVIECNQQRFQTAPAEANSTAQNPQWLTNNGPFSFNIYNVHQDRLMIWVQKANSIPLLKRSEPKVLGTCNILVQELVNNKEAWLPLIKDNKPAGQVLIRSEFEPNDNNLSTPMSKFL